jgi:hypothetical protein
MVSDISKLLHDQKNKKTSQQQKEMRWLAQQAAKASPFQMREAQQFPIAPYRSRAIGEPTGHVTRR